MTKQLEWRTSDGFTAYPDALAEMEARVKAVKNGDAGELVWLLEHPPLYTAGTSADPKDLVDPERFPVYDAGRGGQYTYHGPGQRVAYFMLDLNKRGKDVRQFIYGLEEVMIRALATFGIIAERREGRIGVWVTRDSGREEKIGAIGVRVSQWVTYHGISVNINPDLSHFDGIVPCGITEHGVTSFEDMGVKATMADLDAALKKEFDDIFGLESRPMTLQPPQKMPFEAMPTESGVQDTSNPIEKTHPVFRT